jgi:hypothetical protein
MLFLRLILILGGVSASCRSIGSGRLPMRAEADANPFPCVYLDPFSSRSTSQMGALWDAIALTDVEPEIVKALQIVSRTSRQSRSSAAMNEAPAHERPSPAAVLTPRRFPCAPLAMASIGFLA